MRRNWRALNGLSLRIEIPLKLTTRTWWRIFRASPDRTIGGATSRPRESADKVKRLIISQPSYLTAFSHLVESTPLAAWKAYFKWRVLSAAAPYLSQSYVEEDFAFYGTVLRGTPQNVPRAQRAVALVNEGLGEALGELYVKQYLET